MTYGQPARTTRRIRLRRIRVAGLLVVVAAIAAVLGGQLPTPSSSTASTPSPAASPGHLPRSEHRAPPRETRTEHGDALGVAGGAVPSGTTVFDDEVPGVAKLDPALLAALRKAGTQAADDGIELFVDSGWRSREYQEQLLQQAIAKYGSEAQAMRWVATPNTSAHVKGDAVDLATGGAAWLSQHGAAYGLCQIYGNEPWHFELRPEAVDHGCPAMYADPTHDPRMHR